MSTVARIPPLAAAGSGVGRPPARVGQGDVARNSPSPISIPVTIAVAPPSAAAALVAASAG